MSNQMQERGKETEINGTLIDFDESFEAGISFHLGK
jgi:hypothetical protein